MPRKRREPDTPSEKFAQHMSEEFIKALKKMKLTKHGFYRRNAMLVSASTFNRMLIGDSGASCSLVAEIADRMGLELRLVPKSETSNKQADEDSN